MKKWNAQNSLKCKINIIFFILVSQPPIQGGWYKVPSFSKNPNKSPLTFFPFPPLPLFPFSVCGMRGMDWELAFTGWKRLILNLCLNVLGKVAKKNPEKRWSFANPPSDPPPPPVWSFWSIFRWNFFSLHFLMENWSIMPETDFKQKKFVDFFSFWPLFAQVKVKHQE